MHNHLETCEVLLRAGISKDARTKVDRYEMALNNSISIYRAEWNSLSNEIFLFFFSRTPLHLAVYEGHEKIVELLLKNKCDVNAKDMVSISSHHKSAIL